MTKIERQWVQLITALGCIVCYVQGRGYVPCAVHHMLSGGRRIGHLFTIGLCDPGHHQNAPKDSGEVSRHPSLKAFENRYGKEEYLRQKTKQLVGWP